MQQLNSTLNQFQNHKELQQQQVQLIEIQKQLVVF